MPNSESIEIHPHYIVHNPILKSHKERAVPGKNGDRVPFVEIVGKWFNADLITS